MACSIAAGAIAPWGLKSFPTSSTSTMLLQPRRASLAGSFGVLSLKRSLFLCGDSLLRENLLFGDAQPAPRGSASLPALHIVISQKKELVSGSKSEANVLRSRTPSWDGTKALAVTEGFCIAVAAASYTTSVLHKHQTSLVASSSPGESKFLSKIGDLSTWYVPALWAALVINAILRTVQRKSSNTQKVWEEKSVKDFTLDQRVGKLEEDLEGMTTITRMLSRHLEKLGVRFRVTKRTLRDPIQETVELAQKTSEVVRALANREEILEKELHETQQVLVAMQAQQAKQLELLVAGMTKTLKSQQVSEMRILKEISQRLGGATKIPTDIGSNVPLSRKKGERVSRSRKQHLMKDIGSLWSSLVANEETGTSSSSLSENEVAASEAGQDKENGYAASVPDTDIPQDNKPVYNPDTSFRKEDFWATTKSPRETSSYIATTETEMSMDAQPQYTKRPQSNTSSGKLDSFFSSRKGVNTSQGDGSLQSRDYDNPSFN